MVKVLSNSLNNTLILNYRMPSKDGEAPNPVLSVELYPRALNYEVSFPNEAYYNEFFTQNKSYFDKKIVIEGKQSNDKELKAVNRDISSKQKNNTRAKAEAEISKVESTAERAGAKMDLKVEQA